MDVAKYIGLFLLKNQFCYIHGLGNLEVKKRPATYDGAALQPPQYEITVTPTGSIDDNLANFIATNEQISISKAANALRDFSTQARADLHEGKDVLIPNIGKFVEENGKVRFETDPNLQYTPPGIPSLKVSKRVEEQPFQTHPKMESGFKNTPAGTTYTQETASGNTLNWPRIIMAVVILLLLIGGIVMGMKYYKSRHNTTQNTTPPYRDTVLNQPAVNQPEVKRDSAAAAAVNTPDTTKKVTPAVAPSTAVVSYDMVLNTYSTKEKAEKRIATLKSFGHKDVQLVQDSTNYLVILPFKCAPSDTTHIKDSLKLFNPKGISIFR